eukprot:symbB.v1.2.032871.t1/scaffold4008.1/size46473/6
MKAIFLRLLSLCLFAAPLVALYALRPNFLQNLPAVFVAVCCGVGLAAGVESSLHERSAETLLPQANFDNCRFKQDFGLGYDESTLVHDHVSEFKYLGLILFLFRFVVNIKALSLNTLAVCTQDLPETVGSVARVFEAGIFLEHLCKLPSELLSLLLGSSPCPCIGTVKTLAGFSSMRFLRFLNKRHILGPLRKIAADPNLFQGCSLVLLGIAYSLVLAAFGLAVLLSKLHRLGDLKNIEALGVTGLFAEAFAAESFGAFLSSDLMQLVGFANQVASAMNIQEEELQRLLSFLLGDREGKKGKVFMDQVMINFMKLPRWRWRLVTLLTFDAGGLQKLVRERSR